MSHEDIAVLRREKLVESYCKGPEELCMDELKTDLLEGVPVNGDGKRAGAVKESARGLIEVLGQIGAAILLKAARLYNYRYGLAPSNKWPDICPYFWVKILNICSFSGVNLSEGQLNPIRDALHSEDGTVVMKIIGWLKLEKFIRKDILKSNFKLLSYLDKHLERELIDELFEHYEAIDFRKAEDSVWVFLKDRLPKDQFEILYNEVFRTALEEEDGLKAALTAQWMRTLEILHYNLGTFEEQIVTVIKCSTENLRSLSDEIEDIVGN